MADLGEEASSGSAVVFAVYIVPTSSPHCTKFWEFCRIIATAMCEQGIIAQAIWRLRALSGKIPSKVLDEIGGADQWESTIGNDAWLASKQVDTLFGLLPTIRQTLIRAGVSSETAEKLAIHGAKPLELKNHFLGFQKESFWRRMGGDFVFGDLVRLFMAADFTRGLLLVDEVEKIVYHQNVQERRAFVEALRYYMLDGSQNAKSHFYGMLLTIHPGIQELLLPHWNSAGLDRLAPLNQPDAQVATLYFPPLNEDMALPLVAVYLDHFRLDPSDKGRITPFSKDAVIEALIRSGGVPGRTLSLLHRVVEKAVELGLSKIDKGLVDAVYQASERLAPGEVEEMIPPPPSQVDLTGSE